MRIKLSRGFCILLFVCVFLGYSSVNAQNKKLGISDKDTLQIIQKILSLNNWQSANLPGKKENLIFSSNNLPNYVLKNFPKRINGHKTILMKDNEFTIDFKDTYYRFSNWKIREDLVHVIFSAKYPGGNEGGGNYIFVRKNGMWFLKSSEYWAIAS